MVFIDWLVVPSAYYSVKCHIDRVTARRSFVCLYTLYEKY